MRTEQQIVGATIAALRPSRALDLGTGSGRYQDLLIAAGATLVVGLDFAMEMLTRVPVRASRVCADARRLPFACGAFDVINASLVAGDIGDLAAWMLELAAALRPGGHIVYSDFHPSWEQHGWRRTFETIDGRAVDLPFVSHAIHDHLAAVASADLALVACREEPLSAAGDAQAAKFRRRWGAVPVLTIVHARKSGR
jgi:malonyl-CoA O-methyltransferase